MSVSRIRSNVHLLIIPLLSLLASCVTSPERPPLWVQSTPASSPEVRTLVVYGTAERLEDARAMAARDLERQLTQILATSRSDAPASLVEEVATDRARQLQPEDEYVARDRIDTVEVYRLYSYRRLDRQADEARLETGPSGGGGGTGQPAGDPISALRRRLDGPVPGTRTARERELAAMVEQADRIEVQVNPGLQAVPLGAVRSIPVEVTLRDAGTGEPFAGVGLAVSAESPLVDGERSLETAALTTGEAGVASLELPPPEVAGTLRIAAEPSWLAPALERWRLGDSDELSTLLIDQLTGSLRGLAQVRVTTEAPGIPTAIVMVDRDIAGNPIGSSDAARGMLQEFDDLGFRIRQVDVSGAARDQLLATPDLSVDDLYDILPFEVLSQVDRVIVGDVHIREFSEQDGFSVAVEVQASAYDLRRDRILARQQFEERISGSDARATIRAAFQVAGRRLVRRLAPRLP